MVGVIYIQNIQHIQLFYHGMSFMSSRYTKKCVDSTSCIHYN